MEPQKTYMLGRRLLVIESHSREIRFLPRDKIPPGIPVNFAAKEPFTILGIDPHSSGSEMTASARSKEESWLQSLPDTEEFAREIHSIREAVSILGDSRTRTQYKSFSKIYEKKRQQLSRSGIQRRFVRAIIRSSPKLKELQTTRSMRSDGIFGTSLLVSLILLIVVLTIPVGGVSILGASFFASTLFTTWGPAAVIPIFALVGIGGLGAYWYKKHKEVFVELQGYLGQVLKQVEAMGCMIEDHFMLAEFRIFKEAPSQYRVRKHEIKKNRDRFISEFIEQYVSIFMRRLARKISDSEGGEEVSTDRFFEYLANNPDEIRLCFQNSFSELVINDKYGKFDEEILKLEGNSHD